MCVCVTESLCYTADVNTILEINYTSLKKIFFLKKNMKSKLGISLITACLRREWGDSGWREFSEKVEVLRVLFAAVLQGVVHPSKFIKLLTSTGHILLYTTMPQCGEGDGTPLQYSCLENPKDGGAW